MFKLDLNAVIFLLATQIRLGNAISLPQQEVNIPLLGTCGSNIVGTCVKGSECSGGSTSVASGICLPVGPQTNNTDSWAEVTGSGMPMYDPSVKSVAAQTFNVFYACVDANFQGSCMTQTATCDICYGLPAGYTKAISSIFISTPEVGCNFWVSSNCGNGDGIKVDSGAIYNLAATNYNDRLIAYSCYLR